MTDREGNDPRSIFHPDIQKEIRTRTLDEILRDIMYSWSDDVNHYIKGKYHKKGELHIRTLMLMVIEKTCGIHQKGIELGGFDYGRYKREVRHKARYWAKVRAVEIVDTRRGFDKERKEVMKK